MWYERGSPIDKAIRHKAALAATRRGIEWDKKNDPPDDGPTEASCYVCHQLRPKTDPGMMEDGVCSECKRKEKK